MLNKKYLIISASVIVVLRILFVFLGRQYPIHKSNLTIGNERIYCRETSKMIQCDVAYFEVVIYEDGTDEYVYELITVGNGSCLSYLYIWDGLESYGLSEAVDIGIVSLEDFLESDFVIQRPITTE